MDSLDLAKLLLRSAMLCAALMALRWIHAQVPLAGDYLRRISGLIPKPLLAFLICNVIVIFLMIDFRKFSPRRRSKAKPNDAVQDLASDRESDDVQYLFFGRESDAAQGLASGRESDAVQDLASVREPDAVSDPSDEVVIEDRQVITAIKAGDEEQEEIGDGNFECSDRRRCQRWMSEINFDRDITGECRNLRRSESEKYVDDVVFPGEGPAENLPFWLDMLGEEDVNRLADAFIARQHEFHRQERVQTPSPLFASITSAIAA